VLQSICYRLTSTEVDELLWCNVAKIGTTTSLYVLS